MAGLKRGAGDMIRHVGYKRFVMLRQRYSLVGCIIRRKQSVEKTVECALAHVTDVANLHWAMLSLRTWLPQGISESWICKCKLLAKDLIMGHQEIVKIPGEISKSASEDARRRNETTSTQADQSEK
jgi:hypothetical protein